MPLLCTPVAFSGGSRDRHSTEKAPASCRPSLQLSHNRLSFPRLEACKPNFCRRLAHAISCAAFSQMSTAQLKALCECVATMVLDYVSRSHLPQGLRSQAFKLVRRRKNPKELYSSETTTKSSPQNFCSDILSCAVGEQCLRSQWDEFDSDVQGLNYAQPSTCARIHVATKYPSQIICSFNAFVAL